MKPISYSNVHIQKKEFVYKRMYGSMSQSVLDFYNVSKKKAIDGITVHILIFCYDKHENISRNRAFKVKSNSKAV
jgi:hypothetical protein